MEKDVDRLYNAYQIPQYTFQIYASKSNYVHADGHTPVEDMIIIHEEQLKAGLKCPIDSFYSNVLAFQKLSIIQL